MNSLTTEDVEQITALKKLLGEDCLVITARELGGKLGLDPDGLRAHFKQYFNGHDLRRVLAGEENVGAAVLILVIPPDHSGPGAVCLFSVKPEHTAAYLKFKSESPGSVQ